MLGHRTLWSFGTNFISHRDCIRVQLERGFVGKDNMPPVLTKMLCCPFYTVLSMLVSEERNLFWHAHFPAKLYKLPLDSPGRDIEVRVIGIEFCGQFTSRFL